MRRREFVTLIAGMAVWRSRLTRNSGPCSKPLLIAVLMFATALTAAGSQASERRLGILMPFEATDPEIQPRVAAFREELRRLGWTDDNIRIDERWASDKMEQVRANAAELLAWKPDVLLITGGRTVAAVRDQTRSVPVVFAGGADPVTNGVAESLARPGGNFTGFTLWEYSVVGKMLELLKQAAPGTTRVAMIYNPDNPGTNDSARSFEQSVQPLGFQAVLRPVHGRDDIERAIVGFAAEPNGALFCPPDVTVNINRDLVTELAARHRLPAMYGDPLAFRGGLMSYGSDRVEVFRRAASYVDRILRGERPGDLPVQQPTKYLLTINLSVAKALHLTLPPGLLALADEVIE